MKKDFFKIVTDKISGINRIDLETNKRQTEIEKNVKEQLTSLLKKDGTIIIPHPNNGNYMVNNNSLDITFLIRVGTNRIMTSSKGVTDNSTYSPILVEALKNICDNHLISTFQALEEQIQEERFTNLSVIQAKLNEPSELVLS